MRFEGHQDHRRMRSSSGVLPWSLRPIRTSRDELGRIIPVLRHLQATRCLRGLSLVGVEAGLGGGGVGREAAGDRARDERGAHSLSGARLTSASSPPTCRSSPSRGRGSRRWPLCSRTAGVGSGKRAGQDFCFESLRVATHAPEIHRPETGVRERSRLATTRGGRPAAYWVRRRVKSLHVLVDRETVRCQ